MLTGFRTLALLLITLITSPFSFAQADAHLDRLAYSQLDAAELKAAERAIASLVDRATGEALRPPTTAAEAYVIARQQRLVQRLSAQPSMQSADGGGLARHGWPAAYATRVRIGADGQPRVECIGAASLLQPARPDFRFSNQVSEPAR